MSNKPNLFIIDRDGYCETGIFISEQPDGSIAPYSYALKDGKTIIEVPPPSNIENPRWSGTRWE